MKSNRYQVSNLTGITVIDSQKDDDNIIVECDREAQAKIICDILNEKEDLIAEKPLDLHEDFSEYDMLLNAIDSDSRRIVELEESYQKQSDDLLREAREDGFDFKAVYGANNQSTRQQYVDEHLYDLKCEIRELKFQKDDSLRRIGFVKRMIDMKIELIKYGVNKDD